MSEPTPDRRLGYVLKRVQNALRKQMDERLAEVELTTPQYAAVTAVERDGGISNAELARRCFVTPQTMYRIVERLEDRGVVERTPHPEHGRKRQIRITNRGREQLERAHEIVDDIESKMVRELDDEEIERARELLEKCAAGLRGPRSES